jgi:putative tryptophan/tyrosine transport system substrate-binding protein
MLAGALAVPLAAEGQLAERVHRLGWLSDGSAALAAVAAAKQLLVDGMRERGYVQGKNLVIESRYADGKSDRLPELAAQLVGLKVDLIVANGPAVLRAAKAVSATVPIVAIDFETDAVAARFIETLARPGGNVTGIFAINRSSAANGSRCSRMSSPLSRASRPSGTPPALGTIERDRKDRRHARAEGRRVRGRRRG